jgi:erythromycin esterase-like protein
MRPAHIAPIVIAAALLAGAQQLHSQTETRADIGTQQSKPLPTNELAFVDWARQNAIPLKTVEAGHGFEDMAPLAKIVGNARIVELGEATHGTREFFQLKHRMIEYLATQKGFTIFSIEANMPEAYRLNDFVLNGVGDPKELLKGMYFWTWDAAEVLDMILWMREFNRSGKGRIEFTGFDMQTPTVSLEIVRDFVRKYDPAYVEKLATSYADIPWMTSASERSFGVGTAKFPVAVAAGHHIRYSGYIRTENIKHGYAGLWWRVDPPSGSKPLAFDNMQNRGATSTTPWTRYEISLDVPANTRSIYFGVLHPGDGTAWFDSLQIEIDGVPYTDESLFDLDFESDTSRGFYTGGKGYTVEIDKTVAHSGRQSLRSSYVNSAAYTVESPVDPKPIQAACQSVLDHLNAGRAGFLAAGASGKDADWAIQNARLVLQFTQLKTGGLGERDRRMAENIEWIADQNPGAKLIIWAHNGHVGYAPYSGIEPMGSYLKKAFGSQLVNFGFAFNEGSFRAVELGKGLHEFTVGPAPAGTWDQALAATGIPIFALDLRRVPQQGPAASWFEGDHPSRSIGATFSDGTANLFWSNARQQDAFDAVLFVEKTSAARGVPATP